MAPRDKRQRLIVFALSFPEAWEDHPWGESVAKVGKKVFCFFGGEQGAPNISVKLPDSAEEALSFEAVVPAGYGLGRAGWVTMPLSAAPDGLVEDWIEESYRAVAPARLSRQLETGEGS